MADPVLKKYWQCRKNLRTQMMRMGTKPGESLPADEFWTKAGLLKWSDTTIRIGWYLGVLATEYKLRESDVAFSKAGDKAGIKRKDTEKEMVLAVKALARTNIKPAPDVFARVFPGEQLNPMQNYTSGFLLRDDVPAKFPMKNVKTRKGLEVDSDFSSPAVLNKEESQDQVFHLLLGMALVETFCADLADVHGPLMEEVGSVARWITDNGWKIMNPALNTPVSRGPDAWTMGYGFWRALKEKNAKCELPTPSMRGRFAWFLIQRNPKLAFRLLAVNPDNLHMVMVLATAGNGFDDKTLDLLMDMAAEEDWYIYPLLWGILYGPLGSRLQEIRAKVDPMLASMGAAKQPAPAADGPEGWRAPLRFLFNKKKQDHLDVIHAASGVQYNGLDFLLLHNALKIAEL